LAEAFEALTPMGGVFALSGLIVSGLLLEEAGLKVVDAFGPTEFAGPIFDGGDAFAEGVGNVLMGAHLAQLKEGEEGVEGAGSFTGPPGEGDFGGRTGRILSIHGTEGNGF
jgi:hypothetical protein